MIVAYFDTTGCSVVPDKAYSSLVVDSYTPLTVAVAGEFFQSVLRRDAEVVDPMSVVQHTQFAPRNGLNWGRETAGKFAFPDFLGLVVMERRDHMKHANV